MKDIDHKKLEQFLQESNAIEDVWDDQSYLHALQAWHALDKCTNLTPYFIQMVHGILMKDKLFGDELGKFRTCGVWIGGREGKPWYAVPLLIDNWCKKVQNLKKAGDIQQAHVEYERIHPFVDGNGRTGRIFYNWLRVKNGLPLKVIKEKEKQKYYTWFR